MGYKEGFETLGPIIACFFLEAARELDKALVDDPTAELWRWHLAEECEHRHVANDPVHALSQSCWSRLWGIGYMVRTGWCVVKEHWKSGRIKDPWRSRLRLAGMSLSLHPKYDPMNLPEPRRAMAVPAHAEARWPRREMTG